VVSKTTNVGIREWSFRIPISYKVAHYQLLKVDEVFHVKHFHDLHRNLALLWKGR